MKKLIIFIALMILFFSTSSQAQRGARPGGEQESGMAQAVAGAVARIPPLPAGPCRPTWESVRENYQYPEWFRDAKFGIYMH